jgi:hypothetical protein
MAMHRSSDQDQDVALREARRYIGDPTLGEIVALAQSFASVLVRIRQHPILATGSARYRHFSGGKATCYLGSRPISNELVGSAPQKTQKRR